MWVADVCDDDDDDDDDDSDVVEGSTWCSVRLNFPGP